MTTTRSTLSAAAMLVGALALVGCAPPGGSAPGIDRPQARGYLQVVSVADTEVEIDADGRTVRIEAPEGLCIPVESVSTSRTAVNFLMGDCLFNEYSGTARDDELGGVLSLSITPAPLGATPGALMDFLQSDAARAQLGYGTDAAKVAVLSTSLTEDGAVIAMVEDTSGDGPAFAGDTICRAFTELNGRMTVVSLMSLEQSPRSREEMEARLTAVVTALKTANR